jgi:predicted transcriptional regulator
MKLFDRHLLKHLQTNAVDDEVHIIYRAIAEDLHCGRSTAYRSVKRLHHAGRIVRVAGNHRKGYTYRVRRD